MDSSVTSLFDEGMKRYQAGEAPESLIPVFQEICDRSPRNASAWSCLAWLCLLVDKPYKALKAAQKSVKLDPKAPQGRVNLALALLDAGEKGVRQQVEVAQQMIALDSQISSDVEENIEDGLSRKPDWKSLQRIQNWLYGNE